MGMDTKVLQELPDKVAWDKVERLDKIKHGTVDVDTRQQCHVNFPLNPGPDVICCPAAKAPSEIAALLRRDKSTITRHVVKKLLKKKKAAHVA